MTVVSALVVLLVVQISWLTDWVWSTLYLREQSAVWVWMSLAIPSVIAVLITMTLYRLQGAKATLRVLRTGILTYGLFAAAKFAIQASFVPSLLRWPNYRVITVALAFILAAKIVQSSREATIKLLLRAILFASIGSVVAPAVWREFVPSRQWAPLQKLATNNDQQFPVVLLLLDELGPHASEPILEAIKAAHLTAVVSVVPAPGYRTMHAIPAMFTGRKFDGAKPCGKSEICSGMSIFDFAKVHASRGDIDVVGWYHPYCSIQNLRYCVQFPIPADQESLLASLANVYTRRLGMPFKDDWLGSPAVANQKLKVLVDRQVTAIFEAPFWKSGGILFAHIALPHPPGITKLGNLSDEYKANVQISATFVTRMLQELSSRFDQRFRLLITSDHPLRVEDWCKTPYYATTICADDANESETDIPIIDVSPLGGSSNLKASDLLLVN